MPQDLFRRSLRLVGLARSERKSNLHERKSRRNRRLLFEGMEQRQLLAFTPGDVFAASYQTPSPFMNVTAGGSFTGVAPFATLPSTDEGQIAWSRDLNTAYTTQSYTGNVLAISSSGVVSVFASGINAPTGLLQTSNGRLLVAAAGAGAVYDITAGGNFSGASPFASNLSVPRNMLETDTGRILVVEWGAPYRVRDITAGGAGVNVFATLTSPTSDLTQSPSGAIYATTANSGIKRITAGSVVTIPSSVPYNAGITVDKLGRLLVNGFGATSIHDLTSGVATTFASNLPSGFGETALDTVPILRTVTGSTPSLTGGILSAGLTSLSVSFSDWVNAASANTAANYELRSQGADGLLGTADDSIFAISPTYNVSTESARLGFSSLTQGVYRLTVKSAISGAGGVALDGNADGAPGGDWVRDFVVEPGTTQFGGTTTVSSGGSNPQGVAAADFNGDGFDDLAVVNRSSNTVSIRLNNGAGAFSATSTFSSNGTDPLAIIATDFNHDNKIDLAVSNRISSSAVIFLGNGSGGFTLSTTLTSGIGNPDWFALAVGDFNKDSHPDLVVTSYGSGAIVTYFGSGTGAFPTSATLPSSGLSGPLGVVVGDLNNDSHQDLAITFWNSGAIRFYIGNGNGAFTLGNSITGGNAPSAIVAGDWNGDQKLDLAVSNYGSNSIRILLGNGTGGVSSNTSISAGGSGPQGLVTSDFNMDGCADLAVTNNGSGNIVTFIGNGAGAFPTTHTMSSGGVSPFGLVAGKFDSSSFPDLAVSNGGSSTLGAILNLSSFETHSLTTAAGQLFDVQSRNVGAGQLVQGKSNAFDGLNRLKVDGTDFAPTSLSNLVDSGRTVATASQALSGLTVSREITIPNTGSQDFARTMDVFTNPTGSPITAVVRIVGNLGSDGATTVFSTSDGDLIPEVTDSWIGTDDANGSGTPAIIHYIHGPLGLQPSLVQVIGDNIFWEYNLTVAAGQTVRLASLTILDTTRAGAITDANVLVTATTFGGQAAAFLTGPELSSLANFEFDLPPTVTSDNAAVHAMEGGTAINTGTFSDPQGNNTVTINASVGFVSQDDATGTWTWVSRPHEVADGPDGPFEVIITAQDNFGAVAYSTFTYTVHDVRPTISLSGDSTVNEGSLYTLNLGSVNDPGHDQITSYEIDWGDGFRDSFTGYPAHTTATHTYDDGEFPFSISVMVTDDDNTGIIAGMLFLAVENVAPTATLTNIGTVNYGEGAYPVYFQNEFDPSSADTTEGFHYAYSQTDDFTGVTYANGSDANGTNWFSGLNAGDYTIYARIIDKDDGFTQYTTSFTIDKAATTTYVAIEDGPFIYDKTAKTPAQVIVYSYDGLYFEPAADYANNINAGTATASYTYAGDANHYGSSDSKNFTIDAKQLTATGSAANKIYDATTNAAVTVALIGVELGDIVNPSAPGAFDNKNVASNKPVTAGSITLAGDHAANYLAPAGLLNSLTADITPFVLTPTATGINKVYDGNTNAAVTIGLPNVFSGDVVTGSAPGVFADKNVGNGKLVTVGTVTLAGDDANNYSIGVVSSTTANITQNALTTLVNGVAGGQRSQITSLKLSFASPLTLLLEDLQLTNFDGFVTPVNIETMSLMQVDATNFTITFGDGSSVITRGAAGGGNSLADGNYKLTMAPNGNYQYGAAFADKFFRLFGDSDGDGDVDGTNTVAFRRAQAIYNAALDWDGNGSVTVNSPDSTHFTANNSKKRKTF